MLVKLCLLVVILSLIPSGFYVNGEKVIKSGKKSSQSEIKDSAKNALQKDPCSKTRCGPGRECVVDPATSEPKCLCMRECGPNKDPRRQVCDNFNNTWNSDCHLFRHQCACKDGESKDCTENHSHMHIDYYGECKELGSCDQGTLDDFPRRMKEWLYTIMSKKYPKPSEHEKDNYHHGWVNAIIWKFCDLDTEPHDRKVSRHELFPLRAPLLSMEPCIGRFLDSCDPNNDHLVTLAEWGKCLGVDKGEMEDKCSEFNSSSDDK